MDDLEDDNLIAVVVAAAVDVAVVVVVFYCRTRILSEVDTIMVNVVRLLRKC